MNMNPSSSSSHFIAAFGAVITQKNRPLAFFSRKLTQAQQKYSVTDLELLSIVETLKEFKGMLLGQHIIVYTDHINLTRDNIGQSSDRTMRWVLLLQEFNVELRYVKGVDNTVADAISRLDYCPKLNPHADDEVDEHGKWRHNDRHEKWNFMMTLWTHYDSTESLDDSDRPNSGVNSNFAVASVPQSSSGMPLMRELMAHLFLETPRTMCIPSRSTRSRKNNEKTRSGENSSAIPRNGTTSMCFCSMIQRCSSSRSTIVILGLSSPTAFKRRSSHGTITTCNILAKTGWRKRSLLLCIGTACTRKYGDWSKPVRSVRRVNLGRENMAMFLPKKL